MIDADQLAEELLSKFERAPIGEDASIEVLGYEIYLGFGHLTIFPPGSMGAVSQRELSTTMYRKGRLAVIKAAITRVQGWCATKTLAALKEIGQ